MSRRLGELCSLFVEDHFGGLARQIFACLANSGRLHFPALRARLPAIPPFHLKRGLITLIQHHLVLHYAAYDDDPTYFSVDWEAAYALTRTRKFLDVIEDSEGSHARLICDYALRCGHVSVEHIVAGLPSPTEKVASLKLEPTRTHEDILAEENETGDEKEQNGENDDGSEGEDEPKDAETARQRREEAFAASNKARSEKHINTVHKALRNLLKRGILVKVTERSYMPPADLDQKVKDTVQINSFPDGKIKGSKKSKQFQEEVNSLKRKYQGDEDYSDNRDIGAHGELKRSHTDMPNNKRLKTNRTTSGDDIMNGASAAGLANGVAHDEDVAAVDKIRNDLVVRVNFPKCSTLLRNQRVVAAAKERLGNVTATVYAALLRALEDVDPPIHEGLRVRGARQGAGDNDDSDAEDGNDEDTIEDYLPRVKDSDLLKYLAMSNDDLAAGLKEVVPVEDLINGSGSHEHDPDLDELGIRQNIKQEPQSGEEASSDEENPAKARAKRSQDRKRRLRLIDFHLGILAEHPWRFCIHDPSSGENKVDFIPIGAGLVTAEIDSIIQARFGRIGHRIIRLFRDHGKADDFHIARATLQKAELIELKLTELHHNGLIRIQEVPKDNSRQPNRTLYLYFYDEEMARGRILDLAYQAMSRCLMRLKQEETDKYKGALEKMRDANADLYHLEESPSLNKMDVKTLKKWVEISDAMELQVQRLDAVVLVLRDIGGTDRSLLM